MEKPAIASAESMACFGARGGTILIALAIAACGSSSARHGVGLVAVSNENEGTVSLIDAKTGERRARIEVGSRPRGLRFSSDGKQLYVAVSGSPKGGPNVDESKLPPPDRSRDGIAIVDVAEQRLVKTIASGPDPEAFDLIGSELVVANEDAGHASIVSIDDGTIRARVEAGGEPEGVTTAPDGIVWVTSEADHAITAIDPATATVVGRIATGKRPRAIAFTPDGTLGIVTNENDASVTLFDPKGRRALTSIQLPAGRMAARPMGVVLAGDTAYVTTGRATTVTVIDLDDREVDKVITDVGARPWGIARDRAGLLYTANGSSNDISVIDPDKAVVVQRIPSGESPWGVAVWP